MLGEFQRFCFINIPLCVRNITYICILLLKDFELYRDVKMNVVNLLEDVLRDPDLLPQERKAASNILK